ncbi:MAG: hypothetical protein MUE53_02990 [Chitinophagales bacterium]|nr:hypothetical protein [Chitinophagales bacterium]
MNHLQQQIENLIFYFHQNKKSFLGPSDIYVKNAISPLIHITYWNFPKDLHKNYPFFGNFDDADNALTPLIELMQKAKVAENEYKDLVNSKSYRFFSIIIKLSDFYQPHDLKEDYLTVSILPLKNNQNKVLCYLSKEYIEFIYHISEFKLLESFETKERILIEEYLTEILEENLTKLNDKKEKLKHIDSIRILLENLLPTLEEKEMLDLKRLYSTTLQKPKKFLLWLEDNGYLEASEIEDTLEDLDRINYEFFRHHVLNYEDDWKIDMDGLIHFIFENTGIQVANFSNLNEINAHLAENNLCLLQLDGGFDRYNLILIKKQMKQDIFKLAKNLEIPLKEI